MSAKTSDVQTKKKRFRVETAGNGFLARRLTARTGNIDHEARLFTWLAPVIGLRLLTNCHPQTPDAFPCSADSP
jgi:hypothetical protein